jgi:hypothetical protein
MRINASINANANIINTNINNTVSNNPANIQKKNIQSKLEPYFHEVRCVNNLWTADGLLCVENNKIYRVRIKNVPVIKTMIGAFPITINNSEYIKECECYQVHPHSRQEFLTHKVYKVSPSNLVEWVFVYCENVLQDNYFSLPDGSDINSPGVKADLLFFFTILSHS